MPSASRRIVDHALEKDRFGLRIMHQEEKWVVKGPPSLKTLRPLSRFHHRRLASLSGVRRPPERPSIAGSLPPGRHSQGSVILEVAERLNAEHRRSKRGGPWQAASCSLGIEISREHDGCLTSGPCEGGLHSGFLRPTIHYVVAGAGGGGIPSAVARLIDSV